MGAWGLGSEDNDTTADLCGDINNKILSIIYKEMKKEARWGGDTSAIGALLYYLKNSSLNHNEYGRMLLPEKIRKLAVDVLTKNMKSNLLDWKDFDARKRKIKQEIAVINSYYKKYPDEAKRLVTRKKSKF